MCTSLVYAFENLRVRKCGPFVYALKNDTVCIKKVINPSDMFFGNICVLSLQIGCAQIGLVYNNELKLNVGGQVEDSFAWS